jgi:F-type H+-transporting ATPase subunit delta
MMKITKRAKRDAKRLYRVCLVNGLLEESRVRQVAQRLVASSERNSVSILAHFLRLLKIDSAQHAAVVESATPLPADLRTTVQTGLEQRYGPGLAITFTQRPELIGGMRIQVGCDVYDGSVRAGLEALQRSF